MKITKVFKVNASAERAWEVLGTDFTQAYKWASSIDFSGPRETGSTPLKGAPSAGRVCQTRLGPVQETIVAFDNSSRHVTYSAKMDKMPFFVKHLQNSWKVKAAGQNRAEVTMEMQMEIQFPFNVFPGPMMKMQMNKVLGEAVEEVQYFIEKDQPHPRKLKAQKLAPAVA